MPTKETRDHATRAPPTLVPEIGFPTKRASYNGAGYANSGFLQKGQKWSIRFTRAGTYKYYCLIHFPGMVGTVIVHPRPAISNHYYVRAGYGNDVSAADAFFPETLTIQGGDTVTWYGEIFHTVTFAPVATINQLRKAFIQPVPQKNGPPKLMINPQTAFSMGGATYDGQGLASSGLLQPPRTTYSLTFTRAGVYRYGCLIHPGMDGTIRVLP